MDRPCFHLSIPAIDLEATERWYVDGLGCRPGRRSAEGLILDLEGHQLVAQRLRPGSPEPVQPGIYPRHFGLVFEHASRWQALLEKARQAGLQFGVGPRCRFAGERLEHNTFFLIDPSGNWLEFKHYLHADAVFGCREHPMVGDNQLR
ncbi:MAG: VOC family protein [Cyanobium sp.]